MNYENDENCIKVLIEGLYCLKLEKIIDENDYLIVEYVFSLMLVYIDEIM